MYSDVYTAESIDTDIIKQSHKRIQPKLTKQIKQIKQSKISKQIKQAQQIKEIMFAKPSKQTRKTKKAKQTKQAKLAKQVKSVKSVRSVRSVRSANPIKANVNVDVDVDIDGNYTEKKQKQEKLSIKRPSLRVLPPKVYNAEQVIEEEPPKRREVDTRVYMGRRSHVQAIVQYVLIFWFI